MAELLERLVSTQDRLRPYIERYQILMLADPSLTPGVSKDRAKWLLLNRRDILMYD